MSNAKFSAPITLDEPIKREGGDPIKTIRMRRPDTGDLRGLSLLKIQTQDTSTMLKLAGRVSDPGLTPEEIEGFGPAVVLEVSMALLDFFFSAEAKAEMEKQMNS